MLSRIYIDNYRAFVKFEHWFESTQLLIGGNGSGKSSLLSVLFAVRQLVARGDSVDTFNFLTNRTAWLSQPEQIFEFDVTLDDTRYVYRLEIEPWGEPIHARIAKESVTVDGQPLMEFSKGEVHLYDDSFEFRVSYPFDSLRSALATISEAPGRKRLYALRLWFGGLLCFQLNPFAMGALAEREDEYPNVNLSNFASWYRHLVQAFPKENQAFIASLVESIPGFRHLSLRLHSERSRGVLAEFESPDGKRSIDFYLGELSDGQRCLIALYAILHFVVAKGGTVLIDEPDNFIALREIQPWLMAVSDMVESSANSQVVLISHHPELINQWAASCGYQLEREGAGPIHVKRFQMDADATLSPAELVARGWND